MTSEYWTAPRRQVLTWLVTIFSLGMAVGLALGVVLIATLV